MPCVQRCWPGEPVVILGGGSSLTDDDVQYCRGKARVIAIKEAYLLAPWADVLYGCDEKFWRFYDGAQTFTGLKYALEPQGIAWPDLQVLKDTGPHGLELDASGLRHGYNSGYQAVNLAWHLCGPTTVILLGFDMWTGPDGRQNWFGKHGNHTDSPYPVFLNAFHTLAAPLREAGVQVLNASRWTMLRTFPQVQLHEVL